MWQQTVMDALNVSCKIKTTHRLQFPYFYSSYFFHLINKLSTAKKANYRSATIERLQQEVSLSVELDKTVLIEKLCPHSTCSCFRFLLSFSSNLWPNHKNWKNLKTNNSNKIADLFNS